MKSTQGGLLAFSATGRATAIAVILLFLAASANATTIDLGAADGYAVLALNSFTINGPGTINGNIAIGQSATLTNPAVIDGNVFLNTGASESGNATVNGIFTTTSLTSAISAAQNDQTTLDALTPTQTTGSLGGTSVITGDGGLNVINASSVNMSSGTITLSGSANDVFVINVASGFTSSNSDIVLIGGVLAGNVIWNVMGNVTITGGGGNNFYGTFLDPGGNITVHDKLLTGELIANSITDTSGFSVNNTPFTPSDPSPEPATWTLLITGIGLVGLGSDRRRKIRQPAYIL